MTEDERVFYDKVFMQIFHMWHDVDSAHNAAKKALDLRRSVK